MSAVETKDDIYGQDVLLDKYLQPVLAANGEVQLTKGPQTTVQDIRLLLWTGSEGLFYDTSWRAYVLEFVHDENTSATRLALCAEVARRIHLHPQAVPGSATCRVVGWNHEGIELYASWMLIGADHPFNLVIGIDSNKKDMVIADVNTY